MMRVRISSNSGSGKSSIAEKGCTTLFFSFFAIMGFIFFGLIVKGGFDTARTYFWTLTDCVIESSSAGESHSNVEFNISYSYRFEGRLYTSTRLSQGISSSMNFQDAQRAAQRYSPGTHAQCYVNSSSPEQSVLERCSLWPLLFILLPLVFIAIGVGGIIGVWRTKPATQQPVARRFRNGAGTTVGLRIFGLVFMLIGGGVMYAMLVIPMLREMAAKKWPQVPCEILSSRVDSHSGSDSTTYSVEIRYRYEFKDREYMGSRYNFETGSSSNRGWREEVVAKFPPGQRTLCYVNPADPLDSVLSVAGSADRWFGLIPGVFLIVGLLIFLKAPSMVGKGATRTGLPDTSLPELPVDAVTGEVELKPASTPMALCIGMFIFALFWNGITWAILWHTKSGDWFSHVFLSIFVLIGLGFVAGAFYTLLAVFNPRPVLTASTGAVSLGGTLGVRWRFTGNVRRITHLAIMLEGREEATYRRGTTTTTDRSIFAILLITETVDRADIAGGSAEVTIPRDLIHTFTAPNNKIVWTLRIAGAIARWPDVSAEFPITVLPRDMAALSQTENPAT